MKIIVNQGKCAGHARCNAVAGELFELDEEGFIAFDEKTVPEGMEQIALRASRACPERVITIVED